MKRVVDRVAPGGSFYACGGETEEAAGAAIRDSAPIRRSPKPPCNYLTTVPLHPEAHFLCAGGHKIPPCPHLQDCIKKAAEALQSLRGRPRKEEKDAKGGRKASSK